MAAETLKSVFYSAARRSGLNWLLRRILGGRLLVLCYHGVVGKDCHDQQRFWYRNTVSCRQFQIHLEFLNRHFHPISLGELIGRLQSGTPLKRNSVLVTFDDGYRNNLTNAA